VRQPEDASVAEGSTAKFKVIASGVPPFSYQWHKNEVDISGANGASYTTPPTTLADDGSIFSVTVTNNGGSVLSRDAVLTVKASVQSAIVIHPPTDDKTMTFSPQSIYNGINDLPAR
jgi:hypothetical protein